MKNIFNKFAFFIALSFVFISCGNLTTSENDDSIPQGKGKITISTDLQNGRSVLPTAIDETTTGLKWELVGAKDGTQQISMPWTDGIDETGTVTVTAYKSMTSNSGIVIDTGTWDFTLTASNTDGKNVLSATISTTINAGENKLNFVMQEATENAASGSIEFTLNFPKDVVDTVEAKLFKYENNDTEISNQTLSVGYSSTDNYSSVKYSYPDATGTTGTTSSPLSAGYYILKIELQQKKVDTTTPAVEPKTINTYSCLIRVAPGLTSQGVYTLDELAQLYTITYKLNEGTFDPTTSAVPTSYNAYTSFKLPEPTREGYEFVGWYTDETYDTPASNDGTYKISTDTTLYAKWVEVVSGITHANNTLYISSYEGLKVFRNIVNGSLANDITIPGDAANSGASVTCYAGTSVTDYNAELQSNITINEEWTPIGVYTDASSQVSYVGEFKGNNNTITFDANVNSQAAGLFGAISDGCNISNLIIEGNIQSSSTSTSYVGGIVGYATGGSILNCVNRAKFQGTCAGGIAGETQSTHLYGCVNFGEINGTNYTAGIVGFAASNTSINLCVNIGNLTSNVTACGISGGVPADITVQNCINLGTLSATNNIYGIFSGSGTISSNISAGKFEGTVLNSCYAVSFSASNTNYYDNSICADNNLNTGSALGMATSDFSNWNPDASAWLAAAGRYPLPNIVATDSSEGISESVWSAICELAKVDTSSSGSSGTVTGTPVSDFSTLQTNIANALTDGTVTELCLTNDINMTEYLNIKPGQNIVLKTNGNYSIYRGSGFTGSFFTVNSGATFKLGNDDGIYKITLDGRTSSSETEGLSASYPFIKQVGTLTVSNCIMQYNKNSSSSVIGGAIYSEGTTTITNTSFMNNANTLESTTNGCGGAIYLLNNGNATISNCTFENNTTYQRGGAIYIGGSTSNTVITVSGSTFKNNIATNSTGNGGAICVSSMYGTVSLTSLTCSNNCVDNATPTSEDIAYRGSISSVTKNIGNISCENIYIDKENTLNVIENISSIIKLTIDEYVTGSQIINFNNFANKANFTLSDTNYTISDDGTVVQNSGGSIAYNVGEAYEDDSGTVLGYIFDVGDGYIKIANPTPLTGDDEVGLQWCKSSLNSSLTSITDGLEMKNKITSIGITNYPLYAALPSGDWYVPTKSEFELMLQNLTNNQINFEYSTFWTSTINSNPQKTNS